MTPSSLEDDGSPTQGADEDDDLVELSPSRLNLLRDCERCFWVRMRRDQPRPEAAFPSVVSGIERELRAVFDSHREAGTLPPSLRGQALDATPVRDRSFLEDCRTWQREPTVSDPEAEAVLRGAMDDLLRRANGTLIPLDYKTHGGPPDRVHPGYQRQLECYAHLLRENGHPTAPFGLLLYVYPVGDGGMTFDTELRWVPLRDDRPRVLMRRATSVLSEPIPDYTDDCEFCAWARTA